MSISQLRTGDNHRLPLRGSSTTSPQSCEAQRTDDFVTTKLHHMLLISFNLCMQKTADLYLSNPFLPNLSLQLFPKPRRWPQKVTTSFKLSFYIMYVGCGNG